MKNERGGGWTDTATEEGKGECRCSLRFTVAGERGGGGESVVSPWQGVGGSVGEWVSCDVVMCQRGQWQAIAVDDRGRKGGREATRRCSVHLHCHARLRSEPQNPLHLV